MYERTFFSKAEVKNYLKVETNVFRFVNFVYTNILYMYLCTCTDVHLDVFLDEKRTSGRLSRFRILNWKDLL